MKNYNPFASWDAKYLVVAYSAHAVAECGENFAHITGHGPERPADNLKDAKREAAHMISDAYARMGEMSERNVYAQVLNKDGDCVFDLYKPLAAATV